MLAVVAMMAVDMIKDESPEILAMADHSPAPCDPNPCKNGGTCTENDSGFQCGCTSDFTGDQCEQPISEYQLYSFNLVLVSSVIFYPFLLYPEGGSILWSKHDFGKHKKRTYYFVSLSYLTNDRKPMRREGEMDYRKEYFENESYWVLQLPVNKP